MTARELALVLLKVFGLYTIVSGLGSLIATLGLRGWTGEVPEGFPDSRALFLSQAAFTLAVLAFGILLLFHSEAVLELFFRDVPGPIAPPLTPFSFHAVGLSVAGVLLLAFSLPRLASSCVVIVLLSRHGRELERAAYLKSEWMTMLEHGLETAGGLWLFLGARGLAALWHRLHPIRGSRAESESAR
jgi:hypothetical protein